MRQGCQVLTYVHALLVHVAQAHLVFGSESQTGMLGPYASTSC